MGSPTATTKIIWITRNKGPKWDTRGGGGASSESMQTDSPWESLMLIFKAPKYKGQIILLLPTVSRERKQEAWSLSILGPVITMTINALCKPQWASVQKGC